MHTRASNSELVEPLSEPERTLNRRLRRRNRRVSFERRDERPAQPRIVYLLILDIKYFRHFLNILENYNQMDDEPMWAADCVVAQTLVSQSPFLKPQTDSPLRKTIAFADEGSSNSDTDKIMARIDAMTMKMDAQYKEMQSRSNHLIHEYDEDDKPMSSEVEGNSYNPYDSGETYDPSVNPNDQQNDSETHINFDSKDDEEESTPQPKSQIPKPFKETSVPKPYKPKIPYPQRLRKEKM
ncbi:hypothetical protein Tco_1478788, partial [Tanacetum coccineum]